MKLSEKLKQKNTRKTIEWGVKKVREMVREKKNYSGSQNNKLKSNGLE